MKVLVVHRHGAVIEKIKAKMVNWSVRSVSTGLDGLLACRNENFDLIVCGLDLPVVTGIEMVRSIRIISENKKTPIILLAEEKKWSELFQVHQSNVRLLTLEECLQ